MAENSTKRLYVENVEAWKNQLSKKRFSDRKLSVKVIDRGIVLPARLLPDPNPLTQFAGGVCDKDFNFVAGDRIDQSNKSTWASVNSAYTVDQKELAQLDEDVIFGGVLMGHFGHFLTECFCRLWFIIHDLSVSGGGNKKILFITSLWGYKSYFNEFFQLMGIDKERIVYVQQPTQCRSVTVPEQSQFGSNSFTKEFLTPYQTIKSHVAPGEKKKIYLTRREFEDIKDSGKGMTHCFNEKYFEDFFVAHGFESISMEKLGVKEQISLIMGADEIATTLGTLAHWIIFKKPSAKFITLNRVKNFTLGQQVMLQEAFNFNNYYIVDGSHNFMFADHTAGVCMFGANKYWKEFVADYFEEQIDENDDNPYLEGALDEYVDFWCERYSDPKKTKVTSSLKDMCRRIITLETNLAKNRPLISYQTHVAFKGWDDGWKNENQLSNPLDQQHDIQAIKIDSPSYKVFYAVYFNDAEGWSKEVTNSEMAGTTGKSKAIFGIKIRLDESGAKDFDILYRVHKFDGSWSDWAKNGEEILSHGQKLNSIQISLKPKSDSPPSEK